MDAHHCLNIGGKSGHEEVGTFFETVRHGRSEVALSIKRRNQTDQAVSQRGGLITRCPHDGGKYNEKRHESTNVCESCLIFAVIQIVANEIIR